jgi:NADPH-dependent 2,4-dienoyl-CoA reductase/sulfur reductase-like enzyme/Fe-S-cluster-containing hydrogenase component 2
MNRIKAHMILPIKTGRKIKFTFDGKSFSAYEGEIISSALFANGIKIFSHHHKDKSPQGIFCANGQCSQCTVMVDGLAMKACVTKLKEGMRIETLKGLPELLASKEKGVFGEVEEIETDVLIIGGGPSGLSAAAELGKLNISTLIIDDKHKLGGKLVLQTHKFFGSVEDCFAGTRGIDIADKLEEQVRNYPAIKVWLNCECIGVFSDKKVGLLYDGKYFLIKPKALIIAAGAREKSLPFSGNDLPGVYGAGAFQTLVNRDLIKPSKRLFILGAGNVGLIAAYHALQAGIEVVGIAEAMSSVGGYKVHLDKIKRLGVPVYTSHTILAAEGKKELESIIVAKVDDKFKPIAGSEKVFEADTLLVAVGLNSVNEFYKQAERAQMKVFICGDAQEIAEASAAMFSGKIVAHKVLKNLGLMNEDVPKFWSEKLNILKSKPGKIYSNKKKHGKNSVYPIIRCSQEIPCNPCVTVCPKKSIKLSGPSIMQNPEFDGECIGCQKCLLICPGLAITIVDKRKDKENPLVYIPFEIERGGIKVEDKVRIVDGAGKYLGVAEVAGIKDFSAENTLVIAVKVPSSIADIVASIKLYDGETPKNISGIEDELEDSAIVCRCEKVTVGEIKKVLKSGVRDMNRLKAITRAGMGACGGKTCSSIILNIARKEGISLEEITDFSQRPLFVEAPFGSLCNYEAINKSSENDSWSDF